MAQGGAVLLDFFPDGRLRALRPPSVDSEMVENFVGQADFRCWILSFANILNQDSSDTDDWSSKDGVHSMVRSDQCLYDIVDERQTSSG
jgi:hypothetical protein